MRREQFDAPHRRPVPQMEGIAAQRLEALDRRNLGRGHRTATSRGIGQDGHLMARQRALAPVVDGLPTDTRPVPRPRCSSPLGPPTARLVRAERGVHPWHAVTLRCVERHRTDENPVLMGASQFA